jgi:hypothetical protein
MKPELDKKLTQKSYRKRWSSRVFYGMDDWIALSFKQVDAT